MGFLRSFQVLSHCLQVSRVCACAIEAVSALLYLERAKRAKVAPTLAILLFDKEIRCQQKHKPQKQQLQTGEPLGHIVQKREQK
jgi:hypothetical protein